MSTIAYGLGQGFASGADSVANAVATAERIKNNREQLRIQNQYAQLAQDKWGVQKQQEELALRENKLKVDSLERAYAQQRTAEALFSTVQTGDTRLLNQSVKDLAPLQTIANAYNIASFDSANDYDDSVLTKLLGNNQQLADVLKKNKNGLIVLTKKDGSKELTSVWDLVAKTGAYKQFNKEQIDFLNAQQDLIQQELQSKRAEWEQSIYNKDISQFGQANSVALYNVTNPEKIAATTVKASGKGKDTSKDEFIRQLLGDNVYNKLGVDKITQMTSLLNQSKDLSQQSVALADVATDAINTYYDDFDPVKRASLANYVVKGNERFKTATKATAETIADWSSPYQKAITAFKNADSAGLLNTINKEIQNNPYLSWLSPVAKLIGQDTQQSAELSRAFSSMRQEILKADSGLAVTAAEMGMSILQTGLPSETKQAVLDGLINVLGRYEAKLVGNRTASTQPKVWDAMYGEELSKVRQTIQTFSDELAKVTGKPSALVNTAQNSQATSTPKPTATSIFQNAMNQVGGIK